MRSPRGARPATRRESRLRSAFSCLTSLPCVRIFDSWPLARDRQPTKSVTRRRSDRRHTLLDGGVGYGEDYSARAGLVAAMETGGRGPPSNQTPLLFIPGKVPLPKSIGATRR